MVLQGHSQRSEGIHQTYIDLLLPLHQLWPSADSLFPVSAGRPAPKLHTMWYAATTVCNELFILSRSIHEMASAKTSGTFGRPFRKYASVWAGIL